MKHIAQVLSINIGALTITLAQINELLTTLSLTIAISFTIYKAIKEFKMKPDSNDGQK